MKYSLHTELQNAVIKEIKNPNFVFNLPSLDNWDAVVNCSDAQRQRLECIGDAIMHASMAIHLFELYPEGSPGLYTTLRAALNSNRSFAHLMEKVGAFEWTSPSEKFKQAGDAFEVVIAAYYMERGFQDVCTWIQNACSPMVLAANKVYQQLTSLRGPRRPLHVPTDDDTEVEYTNDFLREMQRKRVAKKKARMTANLMKIPKKKRAQMARSRQLKISKHYPSFARDIIDLTVDTDFDCDGNTELELTSGYDRSSSQPDASVFAVPNDLAQFNISATRPVYCDALPVASLSLAPPPTPLLTRSPSETSESPLDGVPVVPGIPQNHIHIDSTFSAVQLGRSAIYSRRSSPDHVDFPECGSPENPIVID